jgi:type IV secretion system protein VirB1
VILPLALLTNLAVVCAPQVAPATLLAIARTESAFDPLAVHDNTTGQSYAPADTAEAITIARRLFDAGHNYDAGLMQINDRNYRLLGVTLESAFDPCTSMGATAALLVSFSLYNTGSTSRGFRNGYVARVVAAGGVNGKPPVSARQKGGAVQTRAPEAKVFNPHEWHDLDSEVDQQGESSGN